MSMRILHFVGLPKRPKNGPPEYIVISDEEDKHEAVLVREWSRSGYMWESTSQIDDLPGMFPVNRILVEGQTL